MKVISSLIRFKTILCTLLVVALTTSLAIAQGQVITGKITSKDNGEPLPGANIVIQGSNVGTQADANGNFTIQLPQGAKKLVVTSIGFTNQEVTITNATKLEIALSTDNRQLSEVIVTGYSSESKKSFTGSAAKIGATQLENRPAQSLDQLLGGQAAGVNIVQPSSALNNTPVFRIRGINSITSSVYPLFIVDGVTVFTGSSGGSVGNNPLSDINPSDIETIDILKDASATAIYGSRAANGVVVITTKKEIGRAHV